MDFLNNCFDFTAVKNRELQWCFKKPFQTSILNFLIYLPSALVSNKGLFWRISYLVAKNAILSCSEGQPHYNYASYSYNNASTDAIYLWWA